MSSGNGTLADIADQPPQDYGLLSAVKVVPYMRSGGSVAPVTGGEFLDFAIGKVLGLVDPCHSGI